MIQLDEKNEKRNKKTFENLCLLNMKVLCYSRRSGALITIYFTKNFAQILKKLMDDISYVVLVVYLEDALNLILFCSQISLV